MAHRRVIFLLNLVDEDGKILDSIRTDEDGKYELGIYEEIQKANVIVAADNYFEVSSLVTVVLKRQSTENVNLHLHPRIELPCGRYGLPGLTLENPNKIYPSLLLRLM